MSAVALALLMAAACPLIAFAVIFLGANTRAVQAVGTDRIAITSVLFALGLSLAAVLLTGLTLVWTGERPGLESGRLYPIAQFGALRFDVEYQIDALTMILSVVVSGVALAVMVYARGYLHEERRGVTDPEVILSNGLPLVREGRLGRFYQHLCLFTFAMLGLLLAGNLLVLFVFWELVGICSYLLIGFYVERPRAVRAANLAVLVNRIGDVGMVVGMMALLAAAGTLTLADHVIEAPRAESSRRDAPLAENPAPKNPAPGILATEDSVTETPSARWLWPGLLTRLTGRTDRASARGESLPFAPTGNRPVRLASVELLTLASVLLILGAAAKSAQVPLHLWLAEAMEGPTPVSALVHSATMVAAGVYLIARVFPLMTPDARSVLAVVGLTTMLLGGLLAVFAVDVKRLLAWSTVSQLGLMFVGLGADGWTAGLFHLITHAAGKSLLFLGAGCVIHAVHTQRLALMGGLWARMPVTGATMLVGCLAIGGIGIPGLIGTAGFFSKEAILDAAYGLAMRERDDYRAVAWGGIFLGLLAGTALTTLYLFRLWLKLFWGTPQDRARFREAREPSATMTIPLVVLAVAAFGIAWDGWQSLLGGVLLFGLGMLVWRRGRTGPKIRLGGGIPDELRRRAVSLITPPTATSPSGQPARASKDLAVSSGPLPRLELGATAAERTAATPPRGLDVRPIDHTDETHETETYLSEAALRGETLAVSPHSGLASVRPHVRHTGDPDATYRRRLRRRVVVMILLAGAAVCLAQGTVSLLISGGTLIGGMGGASGGDGLGATASGPPGYALAPSPAGAISGATPTVSPPPPHEGSSVSLQGWIEAAEIATRPHRGAGQTSRPEDVVVRPSASDHEGTFVPAFLGATAAFLGLAVAVLIFAVRLIEPAALRRSLSTTARVLTAELYLTPTVERTVWDAVRSISALIRVIESRFIDRAAGAIAVLTQQAALSQDRWIEQAGLGGLIEGTSRRVLKAASIVRLVQTGLIRQYVMFLVLSAVVLFILIFFFWTPATD